MIYLLLYLFMGLALAVSGLVVWRDSLPLTRRLLFVAVLWAFWPLMVAAIIHERWMLRHVSSKCAWCGEVVPNAYPVGNENWREHALFCTKHPLREQLKQVEANYDAMWEACKLALPILKDDVVDLDTGDCFYCGGDGDGDHKEDCSHVAAYLAVRATLATPRPEPAPYRGPQ